MELYLKICLKIISFNLLINVLIDCYNLYFIKNFIYKKYFYNSNILNSIKILTSIALLVYNFNSIINILLITLLIFNEIIFIKKNISFKDASDNVQFFILLGLLFSQFSPKQGIIVITMIMMIVYHMMGYFKLKSEIWRKGDAIFKVMNTETYGIPILALFLKNNDKIKKMSSWFIILFQLTFPLCLISHEFCIFYLLCGFIFHFFIMFVMKLHNFFLVFVSTYPCIYFVSLELESFLWK